MIPSRMGGVASKPRANSIPLGNLNGFKIMYVSYSIGPLVRNLISGSRLIHTSIALLWPSQKASDFSISCFRC